MRVLLMLREVMGWLLLVGGVLVFGLALLLLLDQRLFEAVPAVGVGFVIFRGGIHLLKSALALRVIWQEAGSSPPKRPRSSGGTSFLPPAAVPVLPRPDTPVVSNR